MLRIHVTSLLRIRTVNAVAAVSGGPRRSPHVQGESAMPQKLRARAPTLLSLD